MANENEQLTYVPDAAAIFACALSLWQSCKQHALTEPQINLSESYNGMDQLMREVMRIANQFEMWACRHINFTELDDVWPYILEDKFGEACLANMFLNALAAFDEADCLRVAIGLRLPIKHDDQLRIPLDLKSPNPISGSAFREFRIQTIRDSIEGDYSEAFTLDDDPFDEEFGEPYFGLYGVTEDGLLEHIADRSTYSEAVSLSQKLSPGVEFPMTPVLTVGQSPTENISKS